MIINALKITADKMALSGVVKCMKFKACSDG